MCPYLSPSGSEPNKSEHLVWPTSQSKEGQLVVKVKKNTKLAHVRKQILSEITRFYPKLNVFLRELFIIFMPSLLTESWDFHGAS